MAGNKGTPSLPRFPLMQQHDLFLISTVILESEKEKHFRGLWQAADEVLHWFSIYLDKSAVISIPLNALA